MFQINRAPDLPNDTNGSFDDLTGPNSAVAVEAPPIFSNTNFQQGPIEVVEAQFVRATFIPVNHLGLHARPSTDLFNLANQYQSDISITKLDKKTKTPVVLIDGSSKVDAKSIMRVMLLAATQGTPLLFEARGEDSEGALKAIQALFESRFDE